MPRKRGHGEGSIVKRPDGRWQAAYTVPGTRKRKYFTRRTRRECADELNRILAEIRTGVYVPPQNITVGEYLAHWLDNSLRAAVRPSTFLSYSVVVRNHLIAGLGDVPLQELTPQHIDKYKADKLAEMAPRSVVYQLTLLQSALDQAVKWGYVPRNAASLVDKPRVPRAKSARLTEAEAKQLLAALEGDRLQALYVTAMMTGLRRGELLALKWQDVDLDTGMLRVRGTLMRLNGELRISEPKTEKGKRTLKLARVTLQALRAHRARQQAEQMMAGRRWQDNDLVFPTTLGTAYEPRNLNRHFNALLERAGLRHVRLHDLRHSFASLLESKGVSLKTLSTVMGHSTIGITGDLYVHPYDESLGKVADVIDDMFGEQEG